MSREKLIKLRVDEITTMFKKYPTLDRENKVLHLSAYNTQSPSK
jgi:hypothetical protein